MNLFRLEPPVRAVKMGMSRKDALRRLNGLAPRIDDHLEKISDDPTGREVPHWSVEINSWIKQMEAVLPQVRGKTAAAWAAQIAEWKAKLGS